MAEPHSNKSKEEERNASVSIFFGLLACIVSSLYAFGHSAFFLYAYLIIAGTTFITAGNGISAKSIKARYIGTAGIVFGILSIIIIIAGYSFGYFNGH